MTASIWVYIDHFKGDPHPGSWETLGAALELSKSISGEIKAVLIGQQVAELANTAIQFGAGEVFLADDPTLEDFRAEPYAAVLSRLTKEKSPSVFLFPNTIRAREIAGMIAIDLNTGVIPDVVELGVEDGRVLATRPVYAGKVLSKVVCKSDPQILTIRGRAYPKPGQDPSRSGTITEVPADISEDEIAVKITGYKSPEGGAVNLAEANVVVSGGRGMANNPKLQPPPDIMDESEQEIWRARQGFSMLAELAKVLDAAIGASRAAVDAGYIPYDHQVGQTGKVVSPDLYIACGISGAIQHQAGMRNSKLIVAINKDPDAPIFKLSRFGVVGDLWDVVPALTEAIKAKLGE